MIYENIKWELKDKGILRLTLNRPDKMNAFTPIMCNELVDAFDRASLDNNVAAIVVTGADKAFCAGMDLTASDNVFGLDETINPTISDIKTNFDEPAYLYGVRDTGGRVTLAITECRKPVLAAINGVAVGIGATMTLAMDVRMVADTAKIGFVFNRIGITPEACSTWFLPRLVGLQKALEWCYTADLISADEAVTERLAHSVHSKEELLDAAHKLAERFTENRSPSALATTRAMMINGCGAESPQETHLTESLAVHFLSQRDGKEGVTAFQEKRTPQFKGGTQNHELPPGYPWRKE